MKKQFNNFLSDEGREIYKMIRQHLTDNNILKDADDLELSMLANSFDLYGKNAEFCTTYGTTQKPKGGGWDQIRPEYTVMKNEYGNILKHGGKFGLNPGDRDKIFKGLKEKKNAKGFNLTK